MPSIASYHPQIVHFAIALLVVGVIFRLLAVTGRAAFAGPAALTLILLGTASSFLAVHSGVEAHGPVERVPGARDAVVEHEEWGLRVRNVFFGVAVLEVVALVLARRGEARLVHVASALLGLGGLYCLYEAEEHGGSLVYSYAGGVGIRTGEREDVARLLLAGLYHQALLDRKEGRTDEASRLFEEMGLRFPEDSTIQMLVAESLLTDRKDAEAALRVLDRVLVPRDNERLSVRYGLLKADVLSAAGDAVGERAVLDSLADDFPKNRRVQERRDRH